MVFGDFGLSTLKSTDHMETFTRNGFQNIATGSQIRVLWIEVWPKSCLISLMVLSKIKI